MAPPPPPTDPRNPANITTPIPSEANWSIDFLPPILGRLDHRPDFFKLKTTTYLRDSVTNQVIHDADNKPIKAFAHIPPCISTAVEPWRVEAYFRLHGDFTYLDLWARQPAWHPKPDYGAKNRLNNLRARTVRAPLGMRCWSTRYSGRPAKTLVETVERLSKAQIAQNTTWDVTPAGIVQLGNPGHVLPLGYFLENDVPHVPSKEVAHALGLLKELQGKAKAKGKGHWSEMEPKDLPKGWMARLSKSRARVPMLVEARSEAQDEPDLAGESESEDESEEESEVEPISQKALQKTQGKQVKRKVETSDDSSEEEESYSGEEETDGGEEVSNSEEDESDSGEEEYDSGEEEANVGDVNTDDEVEETDGEEQTDGEEVLEASQADRGSKRLGPYVEHSSEDETEGCTVLGIGKTLGSKHTLANLDEADPDQEGISDAIETRQASKGSKRKCEESSDESWSEDKLSKSNTVRNSHAKVKRRKTEHSNNLGSNQQPPEAMAGRNMGQVPRTILDAQLTLSWSRAEKIQTLEALFVGRNTLSDHTIQVIRETLLTLSEQTLQEMLTRQHSLTDADLAFVFSGFVPSLDVPTPENPQPAPNGPNTSGVEPSSWRPGSSAPSHPTTSLATSSHHTLFQPAESSHRNDGSAMAPPPLPQYIMPRPPQATPLQFPQPAPAIAETNWMAQGPIDHHTIRAQFWADQKLFVNEELAKLKTHNANPQQTVDNGWYGAYDQPWYYPQTDIGETGKNRQADPTNAMFYQGRSSQQIIEELRQAAKDKNLVFYDDIALDLLMSDVNATDFAREYYTRAVYKVEELAAQEVNEDEWVCRRCGSPIVGHRCHCETFL